MPSPVAIHVKFREYGIKWPLHDHYEIEVWSQDSQLLVTLPGRLIRHLVELHLAGAVVQHEIGTLVRAPLAAMPARALAPPARLPGRLPPRDVLRQQRRSRKR